MTGEHALAGRRITESHRDELFSLGVTSRWVDGPVRLHVLDYGGDEVRVPLIVLPGITSPAITWDFVVAELRDLVRPVVVDLRGRGLSDTGPTYALEDYAADTEAVVRMFAPERPVLLGHSLGARIAAATAARGRVELGGTLLVDPPLSGPARGSYPTPREAFVAQLAEGFAGTTSDAVRRFYPRWPRAELAVRARWLCTCDEHAVMESYDRFSSEDFFEAWRHLSAATVLVRGGESPVVTEAGASELAAANSAAPLRTIDGAGHMVPWDEPAAFLAELRSLLEGLGAGEA